MREFKMSQMEQQCKSGPTPMFSPALTFQPLSFRSNCSRCRWNQNSLLLISSFPRGGQVLCSSHRGCASAPALNTMGLWTAAPTQSSSTSASLNSFWHFWSAGNFSKRGVVWFEISSLLSLLVSASELLLPHADIRFNIDPCATLNGNLY